MLTACAVVACVCADMLVAQAGPGGAYENTLLLMMGDHGQTLGGDHGGGSPDETGSVLFAGALGRMAAAMAAAPPQAASGTDEAACAAAGLPPRATHQQQGQQQVAQGASASAAFLHSWWGGNCPPVLCHTEIPQVDLTPTLSLLLGLPIPYGNIGKVPPQLWSVLGGGTSGSSSAALGDGASADSKCMGERALEGAGACAADGGGDAAWLRSYEAALEANADQVSLGSLGLRCTPLLPLDGSRWSMLYVAC